MLGALLLSVAAAAWAAPGAPTQVGALRSGTSVALSWASASRVYYRSIERSDFASGPFSVIGVAYGASYTDTSADAVVRYYRVRAFDTSNQGGPYSSVVAAPLPPHPSAPRGLSAVRNGGSTVLTWVPVSAAYYYAVERGDTARGPFQFKGNAYSAGYTDFSAGDQTRYYRIRAFDQLGQASGYSSIASASVPVIPPPPSSRFPQSLHPYANSYTQVWTYEGTSGAGSLDIVFDARCHLESGYDFLYVTDAAGLPAPGSPFSGTSLAGRTIRVPGSRARFELRTDSSLTYWGFAVTNIRSNMPPSPQPPVALKPGFGRVIGPLRLAWGAVGGASAYDLEYSTGGAAWTRLRVSAAAASPDLPVGVWRWRVRSIIGGVAGAFSPNASFQVSAGYVLSLSARPAASVSEYRFSARAYRGPGPTTLSVTGLPSGVSAVLEPPTLTGDGEVRLSFAGVENITVPGDYPFTIQAAGAPIEGTLTGSLVVASGFDLSGLHAYPNPARNGWTRIKLALGKAPQTLRVRIYDLSGALVREVQEGAPFPSFRNPAAGVYEFEWNGRNDSGRQVASEKYIYTVQAEGPAGEAQGRGLVTFLW